MLNMNNNVKKSTHSTSSEAQKHHTSSSSEYIVMETLQYGAAVVSRWKKATFRLHQIRNHFVTRYTFI